MAVKISSSLIRNFPVCWRLSAKIFKSNSESEEVLMCLCAVASINWSRLAVLIRLPFYVMRSQVSNIPGLMYDFTPRTCAKTIP